MRIPGVKSNFIKYTIIGFLLIIIPDVFLTSCHSTRDTSRHKYSHSHNRKNKNTSHGEKAPAGKVKMGEIKVSPGDKVARKIVDEAKKWLGTPYKYGGAEKGTGTDCSGMVLTVYDKITGKKLPRNSAKQYEFCDKIKGNKLMVGDLVFFATGKDKDKISHVGIIIDEDSFIHASSSKGVVISTLTSPYYIRTFKGFGRVP